MDQAGSETSVAGEAATSGPKRFVMDDFESRGTEVSIENTCKETLKNNNSFASDIVLPKEKKNI